MMCVKNICHVSFHSFYSNSCPFLPISLSPHPLSPLFLITFSHLPSLCHLFSPTSSLPSLSYYFLIPTFPLSSLLSHLLSPLSFSFPFSYLPSLCHLISPTSSFPLFLIPFLIPTFPLSFHLSHLLSPLSFSFPFSYLPSLCHLFSPTSSLPSLSYYFLTPTFPLSSLLSHLLLPSLSHSLSHTYLPSVISSLPPLASLPPFLPHPFPPSTSSSFNTLLPPSMPSFHPSTRYIPVTVLGSKDLLKRAKHQQQETKQHQSRLEVCGNPPL